MQCQDGNYTSHSRKLLSTTEQCREQLQGQWILLLSQIYARQRQRDDFSGVDMNLLTVGSVFSPVHCLRQIALSQPELNPETFDLEVKEGDPGRLIHSLHFAYSLFSARKVVHRYRATCK